MDIRRLPNSIYEYGLGFGEDDAESGHQIIKPVGRGVEMLVLLVGDVARGYRIEHCPLWSSPVKELAPVLWRHVPQSLAARHAEVKCLL